jgi:AraC-like DNA-binding protein
MTRPSKRRRRLAPPPSLARQLSPIDDDSGAMGIRLLLHKQGETAQLRPRRPLLLLPIEGGVIDVAVGPVHPLLDASEWLLLPAGSVAQVTAKSLVAHMLLLSLSPELIARAVETYGSDIEESRFARYLGAVALLPRTNWINEACHRYLFERALFNQRDNDATRFLEAEIVKELYFLCHERQRQVERPSLVAGRSAVLQRAIHHIEAHLFEAHVLRDLAKASAASASTLLRAFKREMGEGPLVYVRTRRLDEALLLLKSHRHSVSEVATLIGYHNPAAFAHAFRARFGVRPSQVAGAS